MDDRSEHDTFELEKSLWGRRSVDLAFDADGFLTGVGLEGTSLASDIVEAAAALPGGFTAGIESATKVNSALVSARRASAEAELTRVKNDVELRQQRLNAAGLDATEADFVRLQRLTQLQAILEAQTKIAGADPALVADLARTVGNDLSWYSAPPPAAPAEPEAIRVEFDAGDGQSNHPNHDRPPRVKPGGSAPPLGS